MFLKIILNLFLPIFLLIVQIGFLAFCPALSYLNLLLVWLIFLHWCGFIQGSGFLGLSIFVGFLISFVSSQFFGFFILVLFIWGLFFDQLVKRFVAFNLFPILLLSFLGIFSYEVIVLILERVFSLIDLTNLLHTFNKLYFLEFLKFVLINTFFSSFFIYWRERTRLKIVLR